MGALAEADELEVLVHPLAEDCGLGECRCHQKVLSQRSQETPLRITLCRGTARRQGSADQRESP
jgi:hypothetical protein